MISISMIAMYGLHTRTVVSSRRARRWSSMLLIIPAMLCIGSLFSVLHAQTLFQPYDTVPTVSRYRSVEECLAAIGRISDSVTRARPEFLDTMPFRTGMGKDSLPVVAITTAQQCAASFNPDSVVLTGAVETYADWMMLYLIANRNDAAALVAQRRISMARQQAKKPNELYEVLSEVMRVYGDVRPVRWHKVQETGVQLEAKGVAADSFALYQVYRTQYWIADAVDDTVVKTKMAERMLSLGKTMPPAIMSSPLYVFSVQPANFEAANFLTRAARMDSLRRNPDAYIAIARANWEKITDSWKKLTNNLIPPIPMMIGARALPITGDFWFSSNNVSATARSSYPRPAQGKSSLVVFLRQGCNSLTPNFSGALDRATAWTPCWGTYASVRRLGQRYPSLEIILVTRTSGYSANTGPMSPVEEAEVLQKWWLGFHRLPATLSVTTTKFFRLEGADRRRIDETVPNDVNYLFGQRQTTEIRNRTAYLIDTNGKIIYSGGLNSRSEWEITNLLDVILQRGK